MRREDPTVCPPFARPPVPHPSVPPGPAGPEPTGRLLFAGPTARERVRALSVKGVVERVLRQQVLVHFLSERARLQPRPVARAILHALPVCATNAAMVQLHLGTQTRER